MNATKIAAVVLAAGKGTRMKSERPKVLHELAGRPMLHYPVDGALALGCRPVVLVTGHGADEVRASLRDRQVSFALQEQQLGTGHALLSARRSLEDFCGDLLLLCGDVPLLRRETLQQLLDLHRAEQAAATVLTAQLDNPRGYGRILRDGDEVLGIVEEKDATEQQRGIREVNTGIYIFTAPRVFDILAGLGRDNAQGEYYLTDVLAALRRAGQRVQALVLEDADEAMGINSRVQLAEAAAILRRRINERWMLDGVTLVDPAATYIDDAVKIGPDTVIHPGVSLWGESRIGRNCIIEPGVTVTGCEVGDGVRLKSGSVLEGAQIGPQSDIGPMAHLRPGTILAGRNKIGNFVETKKATIGEGSKASHLTYIGDAEVGARVNIGCGTITCNYDGVNKHRTIIEDEVFVGSDTQFIAPVRIGRNSLIGAGSTITKDVPAHSLALARSPQKNIENWTLRRKKPGKKS